MATGCFDYALDPERIGRALVAMVSCVGGAELLGVRPHPLLGAAA
jgi:hypothetical protein